MEDKNYTIALLIDTENVSSKYLTYLMKELIALGRVTYKRMYGDFTSKTNPGWREIVNQFSIIPVQQYSYTTGKNVTDSKMIIDAMDILYSGNVDAFCIMSSDSDFTGLARRLKESNMFVIGAGESKTPGSFINACDRFFKLDSLYNRGKPKQQLLEKEKQLLPVPAIKSEKIEKTEKVEKQTRGRKKKTQPTSVEAKTTSGTPVPTERLPEEDFPSGFVPKDEIVDFVMTLFDSGDRTEIPLSVIIQKIFQAYPDFNPKDYGVSKARKFFDGTPFTQTTRGTEVLICLKED